MDFVMRPVARVRDGRPTLEDDFWGGATCRIELVDEFDVDSLAGLADFSHLGVVYVFDRVSEDGPSRRERDARAIVRTGRWPGSSDRGQEAPEPAGRESLCPPRRGG